MKGMSEAVAGRPLRPASSFSACPGGIRYLAQPVPTAGRNGAARRFRSHAGAGCAATDARPQPDLRRASGRFLSGQRRRQPRLGRDCEATVGAMGRMGRRPLPLAMVYATV
jgi:hypothetical protein